MVQHEGTVLVRHYSSITAGVVAGQTDRAANVVCLGSN